MNDILNTYGQQLNPYQEPGRVLMERLTIGWVIAYGLILLMLFVILFFFLRRQWRRRYRLKASRILVRNIKPQVLSADTRVTGLQNLTILLRSVAAQSYSLAEVAGLYGKSWIQFLEEKCTTAHFSSKPDTNLLELHYLPAERLKQIDSALLNDLITNTNKWIRKHHV
ncbi:MAG TPA: hypothetical protein DDX98_01930 [Bacteroidales bacterium]|jgi:hypothetical protein|nr:hypothetical protein [Bacteroidales bacterium]